MVKIVDAGCGDELPTQTSYPAVVSVGSGKPVNLEAIPAPGYEFARWRGNLSGSSNPGSIYIPFNDDTTTVTAVFTYVGGVTEQLALTVDVNPRSVGNTVTVNSVTPTSYPYISYKDPNTSVTLEAMPADGYDFESWSGTLTGSSNPAYITMTGDMSVTANFTPIGGAAPALSLTVDISPEPGGKVKINGSSPADYPYTNNSYTVETEVGLEAVPASGYEFVGWRGNLSGDTNPETITVDGYETVTALFSPSGEAAQVLLYFPHVASDVVSGWETEICVISTSDDEETPLTGTFRAYDNAGVPVSQDIEVILPARMRKQLIVDEDFVDPEEIGYIIFETYSDEIVGYTKFYIEGKYRVAVPAVSEVNEGDIYISHIASDNSWATGISLLNTTGFQIDLDIEFDNGISKTRSIAAGQHDVFTIRDLFGCHQPDIHSGVIKNGAGIIGLELFASGNILSGILLTDETAGSIYYPCFTGDWYTSIVGYNPDEDECVLTINPYSAGGEALTIPPTVAIGGKEHYIGTVSQLDFPEGTAWFQINATNPITGFELFGPDDLSRMGGFTGVNISAQEGLFPKIEKDGYGEIALVNIENSAGSVNLTAYNDNGNAMDRKDIQLDGHEKFSGRPDDIFDPWKLSSSTYIAYSSDRALVGFQFNSSADAMMLDGLPALEAW